MQIIGDIPVCGEPVDPGALQQILRSRSTARRGAMMADHHLGYAVPIGGVLAYRDAISPSGVGYDIGCGNKAVRLDMPAAYAREYIDAIMDLIWKNLEFGIGTKNDRRVDDPLFFYAAWKLPAIAPLKEMARAQLGTIGAGNHYVDVFEDELERVWVGVHFGSRGFGHKTCQWFLRKCRASDAIDAMPLVLPTGSAIGSEYLECMMVAGMYAYAGRDWVCTRVAQLLGCKIVEAVHNHHNFAWKEEHGGEELWVVRKGATPAWPGQRSFVGGSMGDDAVILEGVKSEESEALLYSTVHGAGRAMSRTDAKGKRDRGTGRVIKEPRVTREMMLSWLKERSVVLRGAGVDESPHCYKRLPDVLAAQGGTVRVLHVLRPLGVAMAGDGVRDPYKD